jgi:hypothetical protein
VHTGFAKGEESAGVLRALSHSPQKKKLNPKVEENDGQAF